MSGLPDLRFTRAVQAECFLRGMDWGDAAILMEIVGLSHKEGFCWAGNEHFMRGSQSLSTIKRRMQRLIAGGWVTTNNGTGTGRKLTPVYAKINAMPDTTLVPEMTRDDFEPRVKNDPSDEQGTGDLVSKMTRSSCQNWSEPRVKNDTKLVSKMTHIIREREETKESTQKKAAPVGAAACWGEGDYDCSKQRQNHPEHFKYSFAENEQEGFSDGMNGWGDADRYNAEADRFIKKSKNTVNVVMSDDDPMPDPADYDEFTAWAARQVTVTENAPPKPTPEPPPVSPATPQPKKHSTNPMTALGKKTRKAPHPECIQAAQQLSNAIKANSTNLDHTAIPNSLSLKNSVEEFDRLTRLGNASSGPVPIAEWQPVLDWYCEHLTEKFIPHAFSGGGFREKYQKIVAAMKRLSPEIASEAPQIDDAATGTLEAIEHFHWPPKARKLLPEAVQRTWDTYRKLNKAMHELAKTEYETLPNGNCRPLLWPGMIRKVQSCASIDPTSWWKRQAKAAIYKNWTGHNTLALALTFDNDALESHWHAPLRDYSGDHKAAQKLIDKLREMVQGGEVRNAG